MKKNTLSLALLGVISALASFSGSAFAQDSLGNSSVSVNGVIEMSASKVGTSSSTLSNTDETGLAKSGATSINGLQSRIGIRGKEDLGQGYRAKFELEQLFTPDNGSQHVKGLQFSGRAVVGFDTPYGEVLVGRNYIPAYYIAKEADPFAFDYSVGGLGPMHTFAGYSGNATGSSIRMDKSLTYTSKELEGITFSAAAATNSQPANSTSNREYGFSASYKRDALKVGYAYDHSFDGSKLSIVAASYDFVTVKPVISYSRAIYVQDAFNYATTNYSLGATAPLGNGLVKAVVARLSEQDGLKTTKFGLGYEYVMSTRTSLFTDVGVAKDSDSARTTGVDIGVRHRF